MSATGSLVRLAPLQMGELPDHPLLKQSETTSTIRPDLIPFLLALLNQGNSFVEDKAFNLAFKSHSHKPTPPSNTNVEVLTHVVPSSDLAALNWSDTDVPGFQRSRPVDPQTEYWFARRSYHKNVSVKQNPATASWDEFVYGLRDEHSKHEHDFTPTLYDAHHIMDWNEEIRNSADAWKLDTRQDGDTSQPPYTSVTLAVYEMCHAIPWPLQPRCFPVLVATASTSPTRFIAVTVPVNLGNFPGSFYSNGRNRTEGQDSQQKKQVVLGQYTAVESVQLFQKEAAEGAAAEKDEKIQWVMATASDAAGNLPMSVQKTSLPSQVPKDVSFFLSWIAKVDEKDIRTQMPGTSTARRILRSVRRSIDDASTLAP